MASAPKPVPFLETIDARVALSKAGKIRISCPLAEDVRNYVGNMHGGVIAAIAEAAARAALRCAHPKGKQSTIEMKLNYFRPIVKGEITAVADLISGESTICVANVELFDSAKNLAAAAIVTMQR
ncbi:MAG: PaaI family thioesterase [Bryobacteraceae bacterium]